MREEVERMIVGLAGAAVALVGAGIEVMATRKDGGCS